MGLFRKISKAVNVSMQRKSIVENTRRLLDMYERQTDFQCIADCSSVVMPQIEQWVDKFQDVPETPIDEAFLNRLSHVMLSEILFNEITSGRNHIRTPVLTPIGNKMLSVYLCVLDWAVENGYMSEQEREQQKKTVYHGINTVG